MLFKRISKLMIVHLVASAIFWVNAFPPSTPGAGLSDTKGPGQLIIGKTVDYKRFAASSHENMSKCIKKMNPETQFISIGLSEQSP